MFAYVRRLKVVNPNRTDFYPSRKCLNKADISGLNCLYYISSVRYPYSRLALCGIVCSITLFKIKFNIIKESLDLQLNEKLWKVSKLKKSPITHLNVSVWEYFSPAQGSKLVSHIQEDVPGTASAHLCFMFYSPISWILPIYHTQTLSAIWHLLFSWRLWGQDTFISAQMKPKGRARLSSIVYQG